jgi:DNA polymerase/3'-5' exonuclease PolX
MSVMLAKEFHKGMSWSKKGEKKKDGDFYLSWKMSEKFDGYRALFSYDSDGTPIFKSRTGKEFYAPEWFLEGMPHQKLLKNLIIDGELWAGRENFQMMGTVRKKVPVPEEWMDIQYVVYDITNMDAGFTERLEILKKIVEVTKGRWKIIRKDIEYPFRNIDEPIHFTPQKKITSEKAMDDYYQKIINAGGEGIMIKRDDCLYENGRSSDMLKYKPSFDREGVVIEYSPGKGKYKGKLGGLVCRPLINCDTYMKIDKNNEHIFTLSGMDDSIRKSYKKTHPIGTIITYECSGFTDKGIPRFGRYLRIRDDVVIKDEEDIGEKVQRIIEIFTSLQKHYKNKGEVFRSKSYSKALTGIKKLTKDSELTEGILSEIPGVGKGTLYKIRDIIDTGTCEEYKNIQKFSDKEEIKDIFLKIHGVGPAAAQKLVDEGFKTIQDLINCENIKDYLNDVQKLGLLYYNDCLRRIPYQEIQTHEVYLKKVLSEIDQSAELTIAGSYRRKKPDSGDIDILLKSLDNSTYEKFIEKLKDNGYIRDTLAHGPKKFMGMSNIEINQYSSKNRRIDIMYTPPSEYPFAILYFTGSAEFNVKMRNELLEKGFTLNEHEVKFTDKRKKMKQLFFTEKDIFDYFNYEYVEPWNR